MISGFFNPPKDNGSTGYRTYRVSSQSSSSARIRGSGLIPSSTPSTFLKNFVLAIAQENDEQTADNRITIKRPKDKHKPCDIFCAHKRHSLFGPKIWFWYSYWQLLDEFRTQAGFLIRSHR